MYSMKDKSLTTKEIAEYCQVTQRTTVQWISEGKLKFFRTPGKHIRVNREDFLEFLNKYQMPIPQALTAEPAANGNKRILIVDDEKSMVEAIQRLLKNSKFDLEVAYDGFEAGQKFVTFNPDLVILDIRMPRLDGYKLCSAIRNNPASKYTKILIISGIIEETEKNTIFKLGADDYLVKPFEGAELKFKINALFGWNKREEDRHE